MLSPAKKVAFEKLGSLSPVKKATTETSTIDLANLKARASRLRSGLAKEESDSRLTPQEVKSKLGTVTKLSDLQAKLKSLNEKSAAVTPTSTHRRALFATPTARAQAPKLSQAPITLDIVKVTFTSLVATGSARASGRQGCVRLDRSFFSTRFSSLFQKMPVLLLMNRMNMTQTSIPLALELSGGYLNGSR